MADTALNIAMHCLRRTLLRPGERGRTDAELLEAFVARRNESSFEAILDRHGPMVLGLCRRILRNEADAEDAYQATFLVLVRKAGSIRPRRMLGNWLYGVAHTTALKARAMKSKRVAKERAAAARPKDDSSETSRQLIDLLDRELNALPDIYRAAIVVCDLEGKSIKEAAQQLGCPQGTMASRVGRGRSMLARRLAHHGVALSGAAIASALARQAMAAAVSPVLMKSTVDAAMHVAAGHAAAVSALSTTVVALSEGVLKTMLLSKLKYATATVLTLVLGTGATIGVVPNLGTTFAFAPVAQNDRHVKEAVANDGKQRALPFGAADLDFSDDKTGAEKKVNNQNSPRPPASPRSDRPARAKVVAWVNGRPIFEDEILLQIQMSKKETPPPISASSRSLTAPSPLTPAAPLPATPIFKEGKTNSLPKQKPLPQRPAGTNPMTVDVRAMPTVKLGQGLSFEVIVSNQGTLPLAEMWLYVKLPAGISHPAGEFIEASLHPLAAGETKTFKMHVTAIRPGRFTVEIRVSAEPNYERIARPVVTVEADESDRMEAEFNKALQQTIELEIAYQVAVQKLEEGNSKMLAKLREMVDQEIEKQSQAIRKTVPDDQFRAMASAFRRQTERQFIGMEYLRSRATSEMNKIGDQEVKEYYDAHQSEFPMFDDTVQLKIRNKLRNQVFEREFKRIIRELKSRAVVEFEHDN